MHETVKARGYVRQSWLDSGRGFECTESVPETESDGATGKGGASTAADDAEGRESPFEDLTAPAKKATCQAKCC